MEKNDSLKKEALCIIPSRGGSKGIPRKNIKLLAGKPLIYYAINAAKKSKMTNRVVVSTEDEEIADVALKYGAEVPFLRPKKLAEDNIHSVFAVIDMINKLKKNYDYNPDAVVMLLPTAPLTSSDHIDDSLKLFFEKDKGSVISVSPFELPISAIRKKKGEKIEPIFNVSNFNVQRQDSENLMVNAAIYVAKPERIIKDKTFHGDVVYPYIMPKEVSVDINDEFDFRFVSYLMLNRENSK